MQKRQEANDILLLDSCLSSSSTGQGPQEERQASIQAYEEMEKRSSRRRGPIRVYNLRSLPIKRRFAGEQKGRGTHENLVPQRRRRHQRKNHGSRQGSDLKRSRKESFLGRNISKSGANKENPARFGAVSHEAWPLGNPVLKCIRETGTATFQLQFTSDILWKTLVAQNDLGPKVHQTSNKVRIGGLKPARSNPTK